MNETSFQQLFVLYKESKPGSEQKKKVLNEIHHYIYSYPSRRYQVSSDLSADFYAENIQKIESFIEQYDPSYNISFYVYLTVKIKRRFLNFLEKNNHIKNKENINEFYEISPDAHYDPVFEPTHAYGGDKKNTIQYLLGKCLAKLPIDEEIPLRLHFGFPLKLSHFRELKRQHKSVDLFSNYRKYLELLQDNLQKEKSVKETMFTKLIYLDYRIKTDNLTSHKVRKDKILAQYFKPRSGLQLKFISLVVNQNITFVHRRIKSAKKKLLKLLPNEYSDFQKIREDDLNKEESA